MDEDKSEDYIDDYKRVINETLKVLYMRGNEDGKRFKTDNYIGMEMENLRVNILNLVEDCENDVDKFIDSITKIFVKNICR